MAANTPRLDPSLYRLVVEQVKDYAVFMLAPDGRVMSWNLGARNTKGYQAEEIIGRHFSVFYTREALDRGWPDQELKIAAAEGRLEDEGWRVRKDGSRFWASVVITALRDDNGKLLGFSKITRDLSERKLHEEALRHSEERLRLLVESVVDYAIFMLDPEGMVVSWNAGAQRIKGYNREEILGRHVSRFYTAEDKDAGKPWEELATARRTGRVETEGWRIKKNGERFWARAVVSAVYDSEGRLRGFAKVTQDLTERRHTEELQKTAQNVNEFIAMLAHELRNPLAPIRNAVQVMAQAPAGDGAHEAMRQTIDRQSAQLAHIVDDMLDISRITRGGLNIERAPVEIGEVVRRAAETARPLIETGKHRLEVELPAQQIVVYGDVHRLTQLLSNLLNNAARYTQEGGKITVRAGAEDRRAVLWVRDTGRGIAPDMIERIFDMFVQGRAPLQRVGGGLGIGLALARKIAELHGGSLEAHSEGENRGSEFILRLPLLDAVQAPSQESARSGMHPTVPRRILVVDDNVDAAMALHLLLKSLGHETCVAYDGAQALRMAAEFRPDIVLLDIGMPGLDGYEVARQLRQLRQGGELRIVAITGWGQESDRQKSQEAGFDLHLVKPVDYSGLARILEERTGATLH
jgi:PAS domain S-box-containing protein